ncbi:DUF262 domain-containing protein [Nocardioides sp. HDW12B]|uniref:DUF262 domain-containing protein n=1 Tax=Nocardioides sp. HDW12B TaxID=2714939 RepID=UPI00140B2A86|nr:DUF262 domain-containing protein [Nocardioides sp. HDW12B]QIK67384.1 DUF262 domain-containing protein [Nocardioides sp. HDW12B]
MKGYLTSFARLFEERPEGAPVVERIKIPLIQRDYAQGRPGPVVEEIRTNFLEVLLNAVAGVEPTGLDFVYGKVDQGTFQPLDGQQRLTTLFLLHWYLASRAEQLDPGAPWTRFSYATRVSARRFCSRLVKHALPLLPPEKPPSEWIVDQSWYLHVWRDDPTIQSMLEMVDAIERELLRLHPTLDPRVAWDLLTSAKPLAISFYLLPLDDMESEEDLYIKMNSRGKPLTSFETFKALFEKDITHSPWVDDLGRKRSVSFAHRIDGSWSDLFWKFHGGDNLVDDEFVRYMDFVTQICELREDRVVKGRLGDRARQVFGEGNMRAEDHLDFLFAAFDCWRDADHIAQVFDDLFGHFSPGEDGYDPKKVILFTGAGSNLFELCIRHFNSQASRNPNFTLQQTLLLYAVLLHLIERTDDFPRRLRIVRNLVSAPGDEIRGDRMPGLVRDVEVLVRTGDLDEVTRFSANQVADELRKRNHIALDPGLAPTVFRLEDHELLRGTLTAFEVDAEEFNARALAFENAFTKRSSWPHLTGALLAVGDYQRTHPKTSDWQFGTVSATNEGSWRYLLAEGDLASLSSIRSVLASFLDGFVASGTNLESYCDSLVKDAIASHEAARKRDWRYYLLKHESLRSGRPGIYRGDPGYSMIMMRETQGSRINRDPILLGVWELADPGDRVKDPWFSGDASAPRWLELIQSGTGIRSVSRGFELRPPQIEGLEESFLTICNSHGDIESTDDGLLLKIPQEAGIDKTDRVVVGASFLQELLAVGL